MRLDWGGAALQLRADKTVWWPARRSLLVADLHLGKGQAFRRLGVPVPRGSSSDTLARLAAALQDTGAERLIVLGDFLHAAAAQGGEAAATLAAWRRRHPTLEMVLVRGNHDDRAGDPPPALNILPVEEPWRPEGPATGLALAHHPAPCADAAVLAGHLHPGLSLRGAGDALRLPCFAFDRRRQVGVLPAFGAFTGLAVQRPGPGRLLVLVAEGRLQAWPPGAAQDQGPGYTAAPPGDGPLP